MGRGNASPVTQVRKLSARWGEVCLAFHVRVDLLAPEVDLSDSGWHAQLALRVQPQAQLEVWESGTGLSVSKVILRLGSNPTDEGSTNVSHASLTGLSARIGPLSPLDEAHLLDVFAFSDLEGRSYLGLEAQLSRLR